MNAKTKLKSHHTPTPWNVDARENDVLIYAPWSAIVKPGNTQGYVDYRGAHVAILQSQGENAPVVTKANAEANAVFIVHAVNAHYDLISWSKDVCKELRFRQNKGQYIGADLSDSVSLLEKAIAKAEGR